MSQNTRILQLLKSGKKLTSFKAFRDFGITRLSGRIYDLRQAGHKIETTLEPNRGNCGNHAVYSL
jgi:hypothetical protein